MVRLTISGTKVELNFKIISRLPEVKAGRVHIPSMDITHTYCS